MSRTDLRLSFRQGRGVDSVRHLDRYQAGSQLGSDHCDSRTELPFGSHLQLDSLRNEPDFSMNLKVILVGSAGAGKTALATRFATNFYQVAIIPIGILGLAGFHRHLRVRLEGHLFPGCDVDPPTP